MKRLVIITLSSLLAVGVTIVLGALLAGCVVAPVGYVATPTADVEVTYEPDVLVGAYYVGTFYPGYGFWTGYGWDVDFYAVGHPGYGHYYRGAPREAWNAYHSGPHFRGGHGGGHVGGEHHH